MYYIIIIIIIPAVMLAINNLLLCYYKSLITWITIIMDHSIIIMIPTRYSILLYSYISTCAHQGFYFNFTVVMVALRLLTLTL